MAFTSDTLKTLANKGVNLEVGNNYTSDKRVNRHEKYSE